jgi:hypothetical protein
VVWRIAGADEAGQGWNSKSAAIAKTRIASKRKGILRVFIFPPLANSQPLQPQPNDDRLVFNYSSRNYYFRN